MTKIFLKITSKAWRKDRKNGIANFKPIFRVS
jgi:hypothetical protein